MRYNLVSKSKKIRIITYGRDIAASLPVGLPVGLPALALAVAVLA
jgi:hypothetical protein